MAYEFDSLINITSILRGENGCPWDRKQSPESMKKYIIEEAYETVQAIDDINKDELCEELGDLLFQVIFQAQMAKEQGLFDINDVINGICNKMIYRHPHIFGGDNAEDYLNQNNNDSFLGKWEDNKKKEKGYKTQTDVLRAIPPALPALIRAEKVLFKAENAGLNLEDIDEAYVSFDKLSEEIKVLGNSGENVSEEEIGDIILKMANVSRKMQINAEFSLTKATEKFINKFNEIPCDKLFDGRNLSMELCIEDDLKKIGLSEQNIYSLKLCTHCEKENKLFSYRASKGAYGRLFAFVYIK